MKRQRPSLVFPAIMAFLGNVVLVIFVVLLFTSVTTGLLVLLASFVLAFLLTVVFLVVRVRRPGASTGLRRLMLLGLLVTYVGLGSEGFLLGVGDSAEIFDALGVMVVGIIVMVLAVMMLTPRNIAQPKETQNHAQPYQSG